MKDKFNVYNNMTTTVEANIKSIAIMSNNEEYRYRLTRIWDEKKEIAGIIMINPSKANALKTDRTIMNVMNYLIDKNFGGVDVVNLFSFITTEQENLNQRNIVYENPNDYYISQMIEERSMIIVAWGSNNKEHNFRKNEVEIILLPYKNKLKCFRDKNGRNTRHPLHLTADWELVDYKLNSK